MKATISNYRRGRRTQKTNQMVLEPAGVKDKDAAAKLEGKKVTWTTPSGNAIEGKVAKPHGRKGAVLARFDKGLPGQAIGTEAEIAD